MSWTVLPKKEVKQHLFDLQQPYDAIVLII